MVAKDLKRLPVLVFELDHLGHLFTGGGLIRSHPHPDPFAFGFDVNLDRHFGFGGFEEQRTPLVARLSLVISLFLIC